MKKVLFTAIAAVALFAMTACNNNKAAEATEDTCAIEQTEQVMDSTACAVECLCGDECKGANCEACPNHGTENCCKVKAAAAAGEAVEGAACEHKCQKAEGKECEHKCQKAQ